MTAEEQKIMIHAAMHTFNEMYSSLVNFVNKFPLNPLLRSHGNMNFDQGAYWFRLAIEAMQMPQQPAQNPPEVIKEFNSVDELAKEIFNGEVKSS